MDSKVKEFDEVLYLGDYDKKIDMLAKLAP